MLERPGVLGIHESLDVQQVVIVQQNDRVGILAVVRRGDGLALALVDRLHHAGDRGADFIHLQLLEGLVLFLLRNFNRLDFALSLVDIANPGKFRRPQVFHRD